MYSEMNFLRNGVSYLRPAKEIFEKVMNREQAEFKIAPNGEILFSVLFRIIIMADDC